jgi:hypothetical protein
MLRLTVRHVTLNGHINRHNIVFWVQYNRHVAVDAYEQTNPRKPFLAQYMEELSRNHCS